MPNTCHIYSNLSTKERGWCAAEFSSLGMRIFFLLIWTESKWVSGALSLSYPTLGKWEIQWKNESHGCKHIFLLQRIFCNIVSFSVRIKLYLKFKLILVNLDSSQLNLLMMKLSKYKLFVFTTFKYDIFYSKKKALNQFNPFILIS